jgi:hypothetical protein
VAGSGKTSDLAKLLWDLGPCSSIALKQYLCNYSMNEKDRTTAIYITLYNIIAIF